MRQQPSGAHNRIVLNTCAWIARLKSATRHPLHVKDNQALYAATQGRYLPNIRTRSLTEVSETADSLGFGLRCAATGRRGGLPSRW